MLLQVSGPIYFVMFIVLYRQLSKRSYTRKLKYNVTTAEGMTGIQELHTRDVVSLADKTTTSSDTIENINYDVAVM